MNEVLSEPGPQALHEFLIEIGTGTTKHSGRSLYEHLYGVSRILRAWEQNREIQLAGLFHSVYSTERFRHVALPTNERSRLKGLIGDKAERLAFLFSVLAKASILEAASTIRGMSPKRFVGIPCHTEASASIQVQEDEIIQLLFISMANRIEQASKSATGIGFWLADMSSQLSQLHIPDEAIPIALRAIGNITVEQERRLHSLYLQGVSMLQRDDPGTALQYLDEACLECNCLGEPFIMLAAANLLQEDSQVAQHLGAIGSALLRRWGSPWHKRLSLERWVSAGDAIGEGCPRSTVYDLLGDLAFAHERAQAAITAEFPVEHEITVLPGKGEQFAASRFFSYLNAVRDYRSKTAAQWYPGLRRTSWYDPHMFPVTRELERHFAEIREEAQRVKPADYYEEAENIGRVGHWQVAMFYEQGRRNDRVCRQCPVTTAILEGNDSVRRTSGLIYFSKMAPDTHVAAHRSGSNIRLRCHLALHVPQGECAIRVGDTVHKWEEGKCIVFDDTYEHEVWNRTGEERLVLLVDLWHPDLTSLECDALDAINWLNVHKAEQMVNTWHRNDAQREREGKERIGIYPWQQLC